MATAPDVAAGWDRLVRLGRGQLLLGNIAAARQYFLRAAGTGSATGALLLAETYDPRQLAAPGIIGVTPNAAEARRWYERAAALGSAEAGMRLERLGSE